MHKRGHARHTTILVVVVEKVVTCTSKLTTREEVRLRHRWGKGQEWCDKKKLESRRENPLLFIHTRVYLQQEWLHSYFSTRAIRRNWA